MARRKTKENRHIWQRIGLLCYGVLMLWLLFGQRIGQQSDLPYDQALLENLNLVPFETILRYIHLMQGDYSVYLQQHAFINLFGNVIMFIPLGFLLPGIWKPMRKFFPMLLSCTGIILAVELIQLFTLLGSCDVDDLMLNLLGICMGFLLRKGIFRDKK